MSKYNSYAKRVDQTARGLFGEYKKALEAFNCAKKALNSNPYRGMATGAISAENAASLARAKADFVTAQAALESAKNALLSGRDTIRGIQCEFVSKLEEDTRIDPKALDMATLEILKSGIMRPDEYSKLIENFSDNPTMMRMIGNYAKQECEKTADNSEKTLLLRAIEEIGRRSGSGQRVDFDGLCTIYDRCANNPPMIDYWDEFTAGMIENF